MFPFAYLYPSTLALMSLRLLGPNSALLLYLLVLTWLAVSPCKVVVHKLEQLTSLKLHSLRLLYLGVWPRTLLTYIYVFCLFCVTCVSLPLYIVLLFPQGPLTMVDFRSIYLLDPVVYQTTYQPFCTCSCH